MKKEKILAGLKKIAKTGVVSAVFMGVMMPLAMAVNPTGTSSAQMQTVPTEFCSLVKELQGVFKTLRLLAFIGAAFILAKYGWEAITTGKFAGKDKVADGAAAIGIPMIVGFGLLFGIGVILGLLTSGRITGCQELVTGW